MPRLIVLFPLILALLSPRSATSAPAGAGEIVWSSDYVQALHSSPGRARPILVEVGASWCNPCRLMRELTFRDSQIVDAAKSRRQNVIKTRDMVNRRRCETLPDVVKFSLLGNTLVLFFRQDFFDRERKIKFRFFLVAVQRDF